MDSSALIKDLVDDFKSRKWESGPNSKARRIAAQDPEAVYDLAVAVVEEVPEAYTILDEVLGFMPMERWDELVEAAVANIQVTQTRQTRPRGFLARVFRREQPEPESAANQAAIAVLEQAGLQSPSSVKPYLRQLFDADPLWKYPDENVAFLDANPEDMRFLHDHYLYGDQQTKQRAVSALLESRRPEAFEFLLTQSDALDSRLQQAGYEKEGNHLRRLYSDHVRHIAFPADYLAYASDASAKPDSAPRHPTWKETGSEPRHRFGGKSEVRCEVCGSSAHHLLTLHPLPDSIGITGLRRLELVVCLSCLMYERDILSYQHDYNGKPASLDGGESYTEPAIPMGFIEPMEVSLVDLGPRWKWQSAAGCGNKNRIGGHPTWVQTAEYPKCPSCGRTMPFVLQIDSGYPAIDADGEEMDWMWGDDGICYVFWCDNCKISSFLAQCY